MARSLPTPVRAKLGISNAVIIVLKWLDWQMHKYDNVEGVPIGHMHLAINFFVIVCLFVCMFYLQSSSDMWHLPLALFSTYLETKSIHLNLLGDSVHSFEPNWRLSPFSDPLFEGPMLASTSAHRALPICTFCVVIVWLGGKLQLLAIFCNSKLHPMVTHFILWEHKVHMEDKINQGTSKH